MIRRLDQSSADPHRAASPGDFTQPLSILLEMRRGALDGGIRRLNPKVLGKNHEIRLLGLDPFQIAIIKAASGLSLPGDGANPPSVPDGIADNWNMARLFLFHVFAPLTIAVWLPFLASPAPAQARVLKVIMAPDEEFTESSDWESKARKSVELASESLEAVVGF
jgi:hypothetical protein